MKLSNSVAISLAVAGAQAHYTFPRTVSGGVISPDWESIRTTENKYSHGPVQDVKSAAMTCYEETPGKGAPKTVTVSAGGTFTFDVDTDIGHPGPLHFYLAKVPSGKTAATFDGKGAVWFKIYQDGPSGLGTGSIKWPSDGKKQVTATIPKCVANGEYLLRVEHIALHSASSPGGAQLYIACAQINVTGGSETINTSGALVSFPGAYSATDPGILFQLYWPTPTSYINPGPKVVTC